LTAPARVALYPRCAKHGAMNASQIFQRLSPALAAQIFSYLYEAEKPTYRMAIQTLAAQRKLRPQFVERKPREERYQWLQGALSRPAGEQIGANLLQMWLMGTQAPMLCDFLDALGIPHEENGGIDNLPSAPDAKKLRAAVDGLLTKYPAEPVAVYLHSFQSMDIAGWPTLGEILATDEQLQFAPPATSGFPGRAGVSPAVAGILPDTSGNP
jgi:hypothetical protein